MAEAKKKMAQAEAGSKNHSSEILDNLLSKGKKNGGTLTYGELVEALQREDLSPDEIDKMYDTFSKKGIEIVDDSNTSDDQEDEVEDKDSEEVEIDLTTIKPGTGMMLRELSIWGNEKLKIMMKGDKSIVQVAN